MTIRTYVTRRIIVIIPTFLLISVIMFTIMHLAPGDPTRILVGERHRVPPEIFEIYRKKLGLDQPIYIQYFRWFGGFITGDLGFSMVNQRPVAALIGERIINTLELMLMAELISVVIAVVFGVIAAVKHYSIIDAVVSTGALIGYSIPNFWMAYMGILFFGVQLRWLPITGTKTLGIPFVSPLHALMDHLSYLVLPVSILVLVWTAYLLRLVRSSMLEVLGQDYIITARAKGLKERIVIYKHALRNALLPVITYEGYSIGFLFGGAAVIEYIFVWPGLGDFMVTSAVLRDYPVLMGVGMIIAIMVLLANLSADIAYSVADPRIRYD